MGTMLSETRLSPAQIPNDDDDEIVSLAVQLTSAAELPMVLKTALELGLLEIMSKAGPGALFSPREIASQLPTGNPAGRAHDARSDLALPRKLIHLHLRRARTPNGRAERLYGLAPVCKFFTKNEDGVSLAPLCLMNHDKVFMESWYHLNDAVLEGGVPFNRAYGMTAFEYPRTDPRFNQIFNKGMSDVSTMIMKKVLETYKGFEGLESVVDVGSGTGAVLNMIISKYPSIKGINFDLPHVVANAPSYPGVEHVGGDMFVSVPTGDAIFMKWICHDWSDEHCLKFLKNCYNVLPEDGKVIVAEFILPEVPDTSFATKLVAHADLLMMAYNPGGKERTEKEFEVLAKAAGFKRFRVACIALKTYVMEFLKN